MVRRLLPALSFLLLIAACGDDGQSLEERSQEYLDALNEGDPDAAFDLWSERCLENEDQSIYVSVIEQVPDEYPDIERLDYSETFSDDGDTAMISSTLNHSDLNDGGTTRWSRIDGEWYWDDC